MRTQGEMPVQASEGASGDQTLPASSKHLCCLVMTVCVELDGVSQVFMC